MVAVICSGQRGVLCGGGGGGDDGEDETRPAAFLDCLEPRGRNGNNGCDFNGTSDVLSVCILFSLEQQATVALFGRRYKRCQRIS